MRAPTSHDVAKAAGVHQATVSRALRDDPRISRETRERIESVASELGYIRSQRGRMLSTRKTGQAAIVVGELSNPFYTELIQHLHTALAAKGLRSLIFTDSPEAPLSADSLLDESVDGAIMTTTLLDSPIPTRLSERQLPCVLLNRKLGSGEASWCVSDNAGGAASAAALLAELGHERIGAIFGPATTSTGRDREEGFRAALTAAGIELDDSLVRHGPFSFETGHQGLAELLAVGPPTAVFCGNDVIAIGALNQARGSGIPVPEQLTIIGFDDISFAAWEVFDLTTVGQNLEEMARTATELLAQAIDDEGRTQRQVMLPAELTLRGSHGPPPAGV